MSPQTFATLWETHYPDSEPKQVPAKQLTNAVFTKAGEVGPAVANHVIVTDGDRKVRVIDLKGTAGKLPSASGSKSSRDVLDTAIGEGLAQVEEE